MVNLILSSLTAILVTMAFHSPAHSASREAFIELSADKADVYVQEQLVLTVQLYFAGTLVQGDLSEPEHPHAIIERLQSPQETTRYRDGTRYQMVERRYAIFPQRPGTLTLPAIRFKGHVRDPSRRLRAVSDSQQLYEVPVKPIPDTYPANTPWVPASNLSLSEDGLPAVNELEAGSNLTRQITLQATGLPAEALPPFPQQLAGSLRQYPDQPLRNTDNTLEGLQSVLQQRFALVPVQAGEAVVPELSIPWWNTETDQLQQAVLPQRRYRITGGEVVATTLPADPVAEESDAGSAQMDRQRVSPWLWSTLIFAGLWLATLALWWYTRKSRTKHPAPNDNEPEATEKQSFNELIQSVKSGSSQASGKLLRWANYRYPEQAFTNTQALLTYLDDQELAQAMAEFQESLFSAGSGGVSEEQKRRLTRALNRFARKPTTAGDRHGLPPLYPSGLSGH